MKSSIKKILLFRIPLSICNLRCGYCYLRQRPSHFEGFQPEIPISPDSFGNSLNINRMGGICYGNFCADGETLLLKDIDLYVQAFCKQGHFAEVVTNLTVTKVVDRFLSWDKDLLKHLEFKCSFHYLQLKEKNLLDVFVNNVRKIWESGASASIEITPSDNLIPYIDEVKAFSLENFGALPHLTIARNDRTKGIDYLSDLPLCEYDKIWGQFDSSFWSFKRSIFGIKQKDFCYAGAWSHYINMATGDVTPCYFGKVYFNLYKDFSAKIPEKAVGRCPIPHCYNGHALLTLGLIPTKKTIGYGTIRDRIRTDKKHWLQPELYSFFNGKLECNNKRYPFIKEKSIIYLPKIKRKLTSFFKSHL